MVKFFSRKQEKKKPEERKPETPSEGYVDTGWRKAITCEVCGRAGEMRQFRWACSLYIGAPDVRYPDAWKEIDLEGQKRLVCHSCLVKIDKVLSLVIEPTAPAEK